MSFGNRDFQLRQALRWQHSKKVCLGALRAIYVLSLAIGVNCVLSATPARAGLFDGFIGKPPPAQPPPGDYYPDDGYYDGGDERDRGGGPDRGDGGWRPWQQTDPNLPADGAVGGDDGVQTPMPVDANAQARGAFEHQPALTLPIYVTKSAWTDQDEVNWGKFVTQLGAARAAHACTTIKSCLQSPVANMYADQDPPSLILYSDCAEFPYLLRAYFAYHNGLPFSHVTGFRMNKIAYASAQDLDKILPTAQLDNDPYGNVLTSRGAPNLTSRPGTEPNLIPYIVGMFNGISTRSFRVGALTPNYDLSDVYPVTLDRQGIQPGTVVHSTGHAMIVWNVDPQGVIHVIDGHPDGSMQYKIIEGSTLERSRPDQGLGFYKYRPLHLVGSRLADNGAFYGGKVVSEDDAHLYAEGKFSLDQWFGPGSSVAPNATVSPDLWKSAFSKVGGFFQYLAVQMRDKTAVIQADDEVGSMMQSLCDQMQQRVDDVNEAVKHGVTSMAHPSWIPQDVFGEADAQIWGPYATNGRDGRLKASIRDIINLAVDQYHVAKRGDAQIKFDGTAADYVGSLKQKVESLNKTCQITYTNSVSKPVTLNFTQLLTRLNRMSFDPYLCPEKRWGAAGAEASTCQDTDRGNAWYKAEANMYNTIDKNNANGVPVIRSDRPITLSMMQDKSLIDTPDTNPVDLGTAKPPVMDLEKVFVSADFLSSL